MYFSVAKFEYCNRYFINNLSIIVYTFLDRDTREILFMSIWTQKKYGNIALFFDRFLGVNMYRKIGLA